MTERSLVLIKPDGVQRLLVGRVIARFEDRGLKRVGLKRLHVSRGLAEPPSAIHPGRPALAGAARAWATARGMDRGRDSQPGRRALNRCASQATSRSQIPAAPAPNGSSAEWRAAHARRAAAHQ